MTMKAIAIIIMAALLLPVAALAQGTQALDTELLSYEPAPAQPGERITVYVQVLNEGDTQQSNVQSRVLESQSFSVQGRDTVTTTIPARGTYLARFEVNVKPGAPQGENILRVQVRQGNDEWQERPVAINVRGQQSALQVSDVQTQPSTVEPGDDASITVTLENLGQIRLRDVTATINLDDTPFTPTQGTARQTISSLMARNSADLVFQLSAQPSATADMYRVPLTITYTDEQGETHTQEEVIGLRVDSQPQVRVLLDDVTREDGEIVAAVRIINRGLSEVRFLEATVAPGESYSIAPEDRATYLGNINSDDWETFRVRLTTDAQSVQLPISYTYSDAFNREHQGQANVAVDVPAATTGGPGWIVWTVVLAVTIGAVILWRRRK